MGALFIFIFISVLVISALLFFNKGEKAQEIKSILKDIFENFKELFSNLKKLFLILKDLIQAKSDNEPIQLIDDSADNESSKSDSSNKSSSLSSIELEPPSEDSHPDTDESKTDGIADQASESTVEAEDPSEDSHPDTDESKTDGITDQEFDLPSKLNSSTQPFNSNKIESMPIQTAQNDVIPSEIKSSEEYSNDYEDLDKNN